MNTQPCRSSPYDPPPRWVWRATLLGVGLVIVVTLGGAWWLGRGGADPPVAGPVAWTDAALAWAGGASPDGAAWYTAPVAIPAGEGNFTLTVRARLAAGSDPGAAWGVWLAEPGGARVVYAISGDGHTTTRRCAPGHLAPLEDCAALRPEWRWMPYNRLHGPGTANTITLHREPSGAIRLRLNQERLGAATVHTDGAWGVWVRGGRDAAADLMWLGANLALPA